MRPRPKGKGWKSIGYHFVVEDDGQLIACKPLDRVGMHVKGHNTHSIGICLVGDNTSETECWTPSQTRTLGLLHFVLSAMFPEAVWLGHRDMPDTATLCPGLDIRTYLGLPLWNMLH